MSSFTDDIAAGLADVLSQAGGRYRYRRDQHSVDLTAAIGKTDHLAIDSTGLTITIRTVDFLFDADSLVLNGARTEPKRGDRLEDLESPGHPIFELTTNKSVPPFKYSDSAETRIRVHTTRLKK